MLSVFDKHNSAALVASKFASADRLRQLVSRYQSSSALPVPHTRMSYHGASWVYHGALLLALLLAAATTETGDDEGDDESDDLMVTPTPSSPN